MKNRWDGRWQRQRWTVEGEEVRDGDREEERYEAEGKEGDGGRVGRRWRWQRSWGPRGRRQERKEGWGAGKRQKRSWAGQYEK